MAIFDPPFSDIKETLAARGAASGFHAVVENLRPAARAAGHCGLTFAFGSVLPDCIRRGPTFVGCWSADSSVAGRTRCLRSRASSEKQECSEECQFHESPSCAKSLSKKIALNLCFVKGEFAERGFPLNKSTGRGDLAKRALLNRTRGPHCRTDRSRPVPTFG